MAELRVHLSALEHQAARPLATALGCGQTAVAGATEVPARLKDVARRRLADANLDRTRRELGQLYEQASEMRLVPASSVFGALERAVRDAAESLGKHVEFAATGGDTRLDAHGLSLLRNALIHLVRNAVAHGIEKRERTAGRGQACQSAAWSCGWSGAADQAVFTCRDDGRGIDLDQVRQVLLARGLVTPAEADDLTPDAAIEDAPSRAASARRASVTQLAGRGIGLDVVRETVSTLKGSVAMRDRAGARHDCRDLRSRLDRIAGGAARRGRRDGRRDSVPGRASGGASAPGGSGPIGRRRFDPLRRTGHSVCAPGRHPASARPAPPGRRKP